MQLSQVGHFFSFVLKRIPLALEVVATLRVLERIDLPPRDAGPGAKQGIKWRRLPAGHLEGDSALRRVERPLSLRLLDRGCLLRRHRHALDQLLNVAGRALR